MKIDALSRPKTFTSTHVLNQVLRQYNGLGQMIAEYQSHAGLADMNSTPSVQYFYSENLSANHSRLELIGYPVGRPVTYEYGTSGSLNDRISRLDNMDEVTYFSYLGLSRIVKQDHGSWSTALSHSGSGTGDGGDAYGLDRFGRVQEQISVNGSGTVEDFRYGYDRNGNRLFKQNLVQSSDSELYSYDNYDRVVTFDRGTLSDANSDGVLDTVSSPNRSQEWDLDSMGNWNSLTTNATTQTRTTGIQNQIADINGGSSFAYDPDGNLTHNGDSGADYTFDAWNRMVSADTGGSGPTTAYAYDALGRRIIESPSNGDQKHLYYSDKWQVIEEDTTHFHACYVWGPDYVDHLLEREFDTDNDGGADQIFWAVQDANFDVTSIVNSSGVVQERYVYDPYGAHTVLDASWTPRTGNVSSYEWNYLHQGGRLDAVTGLYSFRHRDYDSKLGRWMEQDPLRYVDGMNLYQYERSNTLRYLDPLGGFAWIPVACCGCAAAVGLPFATCAAMCAQNPKWGSATTWGACMAACISASLGTASGMPYSSATIGLCAACGIKWANPASRRWSRLPRASAKVA